ncbi:MAG TPA: cytochrome c peroxidase [Longimicrobiales bacterium]|nr:cytochrome c peroxidase [Longimicrobiales bacterium]
MNESAHFGSSSDPATRPIARRAAGLASLACAAAALAACGDDPAGPGPEGDRDRQLRESLGLVTLGDIPYPADNPLLEERVGLGRLLFFDPILSGEGDVACATCHLPEFAFTDARQFAVGVGGAGLGPERSEGDSHVSGEPIPPTRRNTTTVFNTGMAHGLGGPAPDAPLFWDGRAQGLEDQALQPLLVREEMRGDTLHGSDEAVLDSLVNRLRQLPGYVEGFSRAFPDEAATAFDPSTVTARNLGRALGAYQRELVTRNAPVDRWIEGEDGALTSEQKDGMELFFTRAGCFVCHSDPLYGSFGFFVTGVPQAGRGGEVIPGDDVGREEHTGDPADRYAFRVPSLRNVELTAPYMHSGVFETLEEVVAFYNAGARPRHPEIGDEQVTSAVRQPLGLTAAEEAALVAFLEALTDPGDLLDPILLEAPDAVPSGLSYTGESSDFIVMASIAAGGAHTCAVSGRGSGVPNGTVYCWGANDRGQLGIGTTSENARVLPVRIKGPAPGGLEGEEEEVPFFYLAAGLAYTCGRSIHQEIHCWGGGAVGGGNLRPTRVGDGRTWDRLDGGDDHVCAIDGAERLFCWGTNDAGQVGGGSSVVPGPREVPGGPWAVVSAGGTHTCALTRVGAVWCWGANDAGQVGTGAPSSGSAVPVAVAPERRFVDVTAGARHTCAVDADGVAWCWGSNERGQLGRSLLVVASPVPEVVEGPPALRAVGAGDRHTCAATRELVAWCWGDNSFGQLGLDTTTGDPSAVPTPVRTSHRFAEFTAGLGHTCAIENARGWCWGANASGQVGNGTTTANLVPGVVVGRP